MHNLFFKFKNKEMFNSKPMLQTLISNDFFSISSMFYKFIRYKCSFLFLNLAKLNHTNLKKTHWSDMVFFVIK